jgi:hypothetical protein
MSREISLCLFFLRFNFYVIVVAKKLGFYNNVEYFEIFVVFSLLLRFNF